MCCNVLQCVAECCKRPYRQSVRDTQSERVFVSQCRALQRVAACCSVLAVSVRDTQSHRVCVLQCRVLQRVAACCSLVAVSVRDTQSDRVCLFQCRVLQRVAACCSLVAVRSCLPVPVVCCFCRSSYKSTQKLYS